MGDIMAEKFTLALSEQELLERTNPAALRHIKCWGRMHRNTWRCPKMIKKH